MHVAPPSAPAAMTPAQVDGAAGSKDEGTTSVGSIGSHRSFWQSAGALATNSLLLHVKDWPVPVNPLSHGALQVWPSATGFAGWHWGAAMLLLLTPRPKTGGALHTGTHGSVVAKFHAPLLLSHCSCSADPALAKPLAHCTAQLSPGLRLEQLLPPATRT